MNRSSLNLFLVLSFTAGPLAAQQLPQPGDRVRLDAACDSGSPNMPTGHAANCQITGTFLGASPDSVTLTVSGGPQSFSIRSVDRFEVSQGQQSHKLLGGLIGLVAGAGITYLIVNNGGSTSLCDQDANQDAMGTGECVGLVALGAAVGAGIGAFVGGQIRTERWIRIPVERLGVIVGVSGAGLRLAVSF